MPPILPIQPTAPPAYRGPTTAELFNRALTQTDFLGDLVPGADLQRLAVDATDIAVDGWEAANDNGAGSTTIDVSVAVIATVRRMLVAHGRDRLLDAEDAANGVLLDARDAGDVDAAGEPVPYDTYRGAL